MRTHPIFFGLLLALLAPALSDAQGRGLGQLPGGGRGQRPSRDTVRPAERTGTASISGRVLSSDTNRPLKRARVLIAMPGSGGGRPRAVTTDDGGRYRVAALPAGTYTVTATKAGFIEGAFGQRRALRSGTPLVLADGQQLTNVDLVLARGGVITGHVLDEDGEPLARTMVQVLRSQYQRGERRLVIAGADQTDDRGQYRVFGLLPGDYVVSATGMGDGFTRRMMIEPPPASIASDETPSTGYAPTYYPGVITSADAARVRVATGQELNGIDFQLHLVSLATVRGMTTDPRGVVLLVPEDGVGPMRAQGLRAPVQQDGTFAVTNVPPGKYIAVARTEGVAGPTTIAMQPVVVSGEDIAITLTPFKGARLTGAVTFESATTTPPRMFGGFRVSAQPVGATVALPRVGRPAEVEESGHFALNDVIPGQYVVQANGARGWTMKAVYLDGRDVTDQPVEIKGGDAGSLNIIFTDRVSGIAGTVTGSGDAPAAGATVIAFPSDERFWRAQTRRIQTARVDQTGAYRLGNLPAGEYLLVATDDVEQGEWFDPAFLESVREKGVRVTLAEGDQKVQALKAS